MSKVDFPVSPDSITLARCNGFEMGRLEHRARGHVCEIPHRHTYYEIFWTMQGTGDHYIDFQHYTMRPDTLFFIGPGQVHYADRTRCKKGFLLLFTDEFLLPIPASKAILGSLPFSRTAGDKPTLQLDAKHQPEIFRLFSAMQQEYFSDHADREDAIRAYLQLLLIGSERLTKPRTAAKALPTAAMLIQKFKELIESHFLTKEQVHEYADLLGITPNHLNDTAKHVTGKTAGEFIRERRLLEAKRMLTYSQLSVLQISYHLNFQDPSYFSRFFRKYAGTSPVEFRERIREKYQNVPN
jgi:AraC family transcriptional activator of pobA